MIKFLEIFCHNAHVPDLLILFPSAILGAFMPTLSHKKLSSPRKSRMPSSKNFLSPKHETFSVISGKCSFGYIQIALSDFGLVSVVHEDKMSILTDSLQARFPKTNFIKGDQKAKSVLALVIDFLENPGKQFDFPLDIRGTTFQQRVWREVRKIPFGETSSYSIIAQAINASRAVRAVGSTCTNNPMFVIIPCHRVLHKGESAKRFTHSSNRQRYLIEREVKMASKLKKMHASSH